MKINNVIKKKKKITKIYEDLITKNMFAHGVH